jgi:hypothetical protein
MISQPTGDCKKLRLPICQIYHKFSGRLISWGAGYYHRISSIYIFPQFFLQALPERFPKLDSDYISASSKNTCDITLKHVLFSKLSLWPNPVLKSHQISFRFLEYHNPVRTLVILNISVDSRRTETVEEEDGRCHETTLEILPGSCSS